MKYVGTTLMVAGIAAFIAPRLNVHLPEGLTIPTLPTDILGGILLVRKHPAWAATLVILAYNA